LSRPWRPGDGSTGT